MVGWRNWVGNWPDANRVAQDPKKSNGWLFSNQFLEKEIEVITKLRVDIIWMVSHNAIEIENAWVALSL